MSVSPMDYCQFLISTQKNYTMTHFANHKKGTSHDSVDRFLHKEKLTGRMIWEHVKGSIVASPNGFLAFDDSVLDKRYSHSIEMVRRQYSGNAHGVIKGIAMVNCLYINPDTEQYWIVDYRLFDPDNDGKTKLDHVEEMLVAAIADKGLAFTGVLFDSWYATRKLMLQVESLGKRYICPLKGNRLVNDSDGQRPYGRVDELQWSAHECTHGKSIKIKSFPKKHKVKLFRLEVSTNRTDWVVTNDLEQSSMQDVKKACALRWKIEQFHREIKQVTGIEKCQGRKARVQRNHIACAVLAWVRLTSIARKAFTNIYQIKANMLSDYLRKELMNPSVRMVPL